MFLLLLASCLPAHPGADKDFRVTGGSIVGLPVGGSGSCTTFYHAYYDCYLEAYDQADEISQEEIDAQVDSTCEGYDADWASTFACAQSIFNQANCSTSSGFYEAIERINEECPGPDNEPEEDTAYGEDDEGDDEPDTE